MAAGFTALGNLRDPLADPYLAIAEVLIVVMAPAMVLLMAATHVCAPPGTRVWSIMALGFMVAAAALTVTVHVVELTVARRISPDIIHEYRYLVGFEWPSLLYGIDVVAWDIFFGLSLLCAAPVFGASRNVAARNGLLISGVLCLAGIVGPAVGNLGWRDIGIAGYAVAFPITCLALRKACRTARTAADQGLEPSARCTNQDGMAGEAGVVPGARCSRSSLVSAGWTGTKRG